MKNFIKSYITVSRLITGFAIIVLILGGAFFYNNSNNRNIKEQKEYLESIKLSEKEIGENISYLIAEILKPNLELITSSYKQIQKVDFNNISKIKEFLVNRSADLLMQMVFILVVNWTVNLLVLKILICPGAMILEIEVGINWLSRTIKFI